MLVETHVKPVFKIAILFSIALIITWGIVNQKKCDKKEVQILEQLNCLERDNPVISSIKLSKYAPGYDGNLVSNDFVITNRDQIDSIKQMIIQRKSDTERRPAMDWTVLMTLYFVNGDRFSFEVMGILDSEKSPIVARLNFQRGSCGDRIPQYSNDLGGYLEKITNYNGTKYR